MDPRGEHEADDCTGIHLGCSSAESDGEVGNRGGERHLGGQDDTVGFGR